jgi:hypothetical protein
MLKLKYFNGKKLIFLSNIWPCKDDSRVASNLIK